MLLGLAGYYCTFIPQCSMLTNRLNGIKKADKFLWNEEIEGDFIELKRAFTEGGIQAFPDFGVGDLFILITDWSKENIEGAFNRSRMGRRDSSAVGEESVTSTREIILVTKENC